MNILKFALKVILILIGGAMLLGGGICVATNAAFIIPSLFHKEVTLYLMLMAVSAAVAAAGWGLLKLSGVMKPPRPVQNAEPAKMNDSDAG